MFTYQLTQLLINNQIPVSSRVSTLKIVLNIDYFAVFPLTTDQKVWGSNPYGCTSIIFTHELLIFFIPSHRHKFLVIFEVIFFI